MGRRFRRFGVPLIAIAIAAATPLAAGAAPPDDTSDRPHSQNMHIIGSSLRPGAVFGPEPDGPGDVPWDTRNTDLAFWGTTVIQGRYDGFRVIDIKAPGNPRELAYFQCISPQGDIGVWGNLVFRAVDSGRLTDQCQSTGIGQGLGSGFEGIQIFDISNLKDIRMIKAVPLDCGTHTFTVVPDLSNGRVLLYNSVSGSNNQAQPGPFGNRCTNPFRREDIVAVPLNDPTSASVINSFSLGQSPTGQFVNTCHDFGVILGSVNLGACAGNPLTSIFDLTDPAAPVFLRTITSPTVNTYHSAVFSSDGSIVALGWEPGGGTAPRCMETGTPLGPGSTQLQTDEMKTIFFHDTATGELIGRHVLPRPQSNVENCTIHNYNIVPHPTRNLLVHGSYQSGTALVDFTDPTNAYEVAWMDPELLDPQGRTLFRGGDWSSYWYNGFIYESDTRRGLYVMKVSAPEVGGPALKLPYLNPQTLQVSTN